MRALVVKLSVDDDEQDMIHQMANKANLSVAEFLRFVLYYQAGISGFIPMEKAEKFTRRTWRSKTRPMGPQWKS